MTRKKWNLTAVASVVMRSVTAEKWNLELFEDSLGGRRKRGRRRFGGVEKKKRMLQVASYRLWGGGFAMRV